MLQIELDSFKVNQEALNESSKERFNFIETEIQSLRRKIEENNRTISTVVLNHSREEEDKYPGDSINIIFYE